MKFITRTITLFFPLQQFQFLDCKTALKLPTLALARRTSLIWPALSIVCVLSFSCLIFGFKRVHPSFCHFYFYFYFHFDFYSFRFRCCRPENCVLIFTQTETVAFSTYSVCTFAVFTRNVGSWYLWGFCLNICIFIVATATSTSTAGTSFLPCFISRFVCWQCFLSAPGQISPLILYILSVNWMAGWMAGV